MSLGWGSIPLWVGVILTSGSVAIAARTYVVNSRRALREEASRVTVTLHQAQRAPDVLRTATVTNHSSAPIWGVSVDVHRYTTMEISPLEPVVSPGESFTFTTEVFWWEKFAPGALSQLVEAPLYGVVHFVDAQGYRWRRSTTGLLSPPFQAGIFRGGELGRFYRFRKGVVPQRVRHWFRNRWGAYLSARPKRYRGSGHKF